MAENSIDEKPKVAEPDDFISFEERWTQLLDDCKQKLDSLSDDDKDGQIRDLWTKINKFVTIMAVPKAIKPRMRKTLWKMAWRSSFSQCMTILLYCLLTFFPRRSYRSVEAQQYFKQRLTRNGGKP